MSGLNENQILSTGSKTKVKHLRTALHPIGLMAEQTSGRWVDWPSVGRRGGANKYYPPALKQKNDADWGRFVGGQK